jgi:hypothetical protein
LNEECKKIGLEKLFIPSTDFDPIFANECSSSKSSLFIPGDDFDPIFTTDGSGSKCIQKIKQKTYINVDEEGTEAAVVTANVVGETCMRQPEFKKIEFIADRPFSFFIIGPGTSSRRARSSGAIVLFAGKFYNY